MARFSIGEAVSFGWNTVKNNLGFFIVLAFIIVLIGLAPSFFYYLTGNRFPLIGALFNLVFYFINIVVGMGLIKISLKFVDGSKGEYNDLFSCLPLFLNYFLSSLLYGLIVLGGLILLIVPGIIWGIKFQYFSYFIIDKGLGPVAALKKSADITKGAKWNLFVFGWVLGFINLLGVILFGVGLLLTIPTTMIAQAYVYRKLSGLAQAQVAEIQGATPTPQAPIIQN